MGCRINKEAYEKLIEEDLDRLKTDMPRSLERDHIEVVLEASIDLLYPKE